MNNLRIINPHLPIFSKNWIWFLIWGIVLISLGVLALIFSGLTTLVTIVVLGFVIFASGIVIMLDAMTFWRGKWRGFLIHFLMGLLYFIVGLVLIGGPLIASLYLTLILGLFYIFVGLSRIYYALVMKTPKWGWSFLNGLIALLLGFLILFHWPTSSLFIIGIFIGIDLIFSGWAYIMTGVTGRRYRLSL